MSLLAAFGGLSLNPIAKPIAAILAAIYSVIPNYGVAILVLSVVWMVLISPLTLKTTRSMLAMQKLQPQLKKLQEQHRNDRAALSQATMDLYKEHNVSPFGSCLPTLLPLPIFFALFEVIDGLSRTVNGQAAPRYLSPNTQMYKDIVAAHGHLNAFGVDLSSNALSAHSSVLAAIPYFVLILIMMGTQYLQSVQMFNRNPANADNPQARMMKYLPLVFGLFCIRFPAGVVLYYAMSNVCRIAQQSAMYRFDPKVKTLAAKEVQEVEAETRDIETGKRKREPVVPTQPAPRSRFRDLLASAAEQQAKSKQDREAAKGKGAQPPKGTPPAKGKQPPAAKGAPGQAKGGKGGSGGAPARGSRGAGGPQAGPAPQKTEVPAGTRSSGKGAAGQAPAAQQTTTSKAAAGNEASPAAPGGNGSGTGDAGANGGNRARTGAGTSTGRTGAGRSQRTSRKRRGR